MDEKRQKLIFLVDDDAKLRKLLVKFLRSMVLSCANFQTVRW